MDVFPFSVPLFVPAHRNERFSKAAASGADAIILDLEDAVAVDAKDSARASLRSDFTDLPVLVRVNGKHTPWYEADIEAAFRLGFDGIIVPKAELCDDLARLAATSPVPILALIESAQGVAQAREIAALPGLVRLIFGSIDFCADLGCAHTREALLQVRAELVLASRLAAITAPVDGVTVSIDDNEQTTSDARYALELGFSGKLAIHPRQVEAIRSGFKPKPSEIEWAHKILASGDGAVAVDGAMVDEPVRIRARAILARSVV